MKIDPYQILQVERAATEEDIKRSFRQRVMETHPDHGGDRDQFELVKLASDVLMDAERRAKYDATGEVDVKAVDISEQQACNVLAGLLQAALMQDGDLFTVDLKGQILAHLGKVMADLDIQVKTLDRAKTRAEKMIKRWKRRSEGENLLVRMCDWQLESITRTLENNRTMHRAHKRASEMLADYDFERDIVQMVQNVYTISRSTPTW